MLCSKGFFLVVSSMTTQSVVSWISPSSSSLSLLSSSHTRSSTCLFHDKQNFFFADPATPDDAAAAPWIGEDGYDDDDDDFVVNQFSQSDNGVAYSYNDDNDDDDESSKKKVFAPVDASDVLGPPEEDPIAPLVRTIVKAADLRKAEDIVALRVSKFTTLTTFIVLCTGHSRPQNQAIRVSIQDDLEDQHGLRPQNGLSEGTADSGWVLLDFGSVMVHVMTPKSRAFYDLEGQWSKKGGEYMDLSNVVIPNSIIPDAQLGGSMALNEQDDPFWS